MELIYPNLPTFATYPADSDRLWVRWTLPRRVAPPRGSAPPAEVNPSDASGVQVLRAVLQPPYPPSGRMLGREERRPLTVVVQGSLSCGDWYLGWCLYELRLMRGTVSPGWYPAGVRLITSPTAPRELGSCGHTQRTPRGASSCPDPGLRSAGAGLRHHPRSTFPPGPVLSVACLHVRTRTCRSGQFGRWSGSVPDLLPRRTPSPLRQAPLQAVQIRPSLRS